MQTRLRGIVPPLVTPLADRDTLDVAGLERLIEHVLAGGVNGLFILGTTGEAPDLSYHLRRELVDRVCRQVARRVPVLVGITDTAFVESLNLARYAAAAGADALVAAPPYYFPAGQPELVDFVTRLVAELPRPLILYNMPQLTKTAFAIDTLRQLAGLAGVAGIKDSSGDLDYFRSVLSLARETRPDWSVFIGPEEHLAEAVGLGADGGVSGGAQIAPKLFVDVHAAAVAGDMRRLAVLQADVITLGRIYAVGRHASAVVKGTKCALSLMGLCRDVMAEPLTKFEAPERAAVRAVLESLHIPVKNP
ncbi:MAG: dihydrodipicolinate synthase family protein [Acidobacteria bacterium]|nr:dihydrodipicolinate synthase family protein [Acidobacteriota bacterium]